MHEDTIEPRRAGAPTSALRAVVLRGVSRDFGDTRALASVDLRVAVGEIHALLGRNGAGKTTLLRLVCGLSEPTEGSVLLERASGTAPGGWDARRITGIVASGSRSFYLRLSGLENLSFFGRLHGMSRRDSLERSASLLHEVGLNGSGRKPVGEYSQGMRRRLAVARALLASPEIILMDEATHDLDPEGAELIRDLARRAAADGAAVIWATQRLEEVRDFAHRVCVLDSGAVQFQGTVNELVEGTPVRRYIVGVRPVDDLGTPVPHAALDAHSYVFPREGSTPDELVLELTGGASLGQALLRLSALVEVVTCREERPGVESAFLGLTGGRV